MREILVVKRNVLFPDKAFQGFCFVKEKDFMSLILGAHEYIDREMAEKNTEWKQPIPYVWIINSKTKKVFVYKRANSESYKEIRLRDKWSCGIGGHIDKVTDESGDNPIIAAMLRELEEEVLIEVYSKPKIIGYLNDDSDNIGRDHFGVIGVLEVNNDITINDEGEIAEGKFMNSDEIEKLFKREDVEVEGWTRISWPLVKEYLK